MKEVSTNWTRATKDVSKAIVGLVSAINAGLNAWVEVRKNGDQDYPIMITNPELNDVVNWTMAYGVPRNKKEIEKHSFLNDVEKDLTMNYTTAFGSEEAARHYYETGELTEANFRGIGYCHAVKIADATEYRKKTDDYQYGYWMEFWQPRKGFTYRVVDESIGDVFVVCTNHESVDSKTALLKASEFLAQLAK